MNTISILTNSKLCLNERLLEKRQQQKIYYLFVTLSEKALNFLYR